MLANTLPVLEVVDADDVAFGAVALPADPAPALPAVAGAVVEVDD